MKLSLSVKITIKDIYPKDKSIQYEKYICLFSLNNFKSKLYLSDLKNKNFIKHKIESFNSNIIYNLHMFDLKKNSLIGIYQLIINFDKIKHLNINDTLTQEETAKLIIDPKTKRKIFDKITNMGNIYLILSTEIKIINKKILSSKNKQNTNIKKVVNIENNDNISEFKLTPKTFKKKQIIRTMKNDNRDILKRKDNNMGYDETSMIDCFKDENDTTFSPDSTIKKYKSLNKAKMMGLNNNKYNEFNYNTSNHCFNNSCTFIMSPKCSNTNYNFKKEGNINIKTNRKKSLAQNKVSTLNLLEQKVEPSLYKTKEDNFLELSTQSKGFKNTSVNFNKTKINNIKKNSFSSLNNYNNNFNEIKKQILIKKKSKNNFDESDYYQRKTYQNKKRIVVNLSRKYNNNEKVITERKEKIKNNKKRLSLNDLGKSNIDMNKNDYLLNNNINNIFLQTESSIRILSERKDLRNNINNTDTKQILKERSNNNLIGNNYSNNFYMEKSRGTFSPKLSLKIKFSHGNILSNEKNNNKYRDMSNKKILTPKGNQMKIVSFNNEDNIKKENEELKKKCFNIIDLYSLFITKLKKTCKNNVKYIKKCEIIKERYNNLKKYKYKIIQIQNLNESKKIEKHANSHYEEEKLLNKMINIKLKENSIYQNIFGEYSDKENLQSKINILFGQKKEMFLNLIRNIVKYYGNISQIYNNNKNKKDILKNLLNKYDIKEKIKINLNYINYINKGNNFDDKVITEVDEDKENEEENEEILENNNNKDNCNLNNSKREIQINLNKNNNINNINNIFYDNLEQEEENNNNNNKIKEIKITKIKNNINNIKIDNNIDSIKIDNNNINNNYDENLNNLIQKILIEQFPENYKTNINFIHQEKNKYIFKNKIFYAYIEDNDVVLKEEINGIINDNKFTLNEFYQNYCIPKNNINNNFIYTKKIRQKYIKLKYNDNEQSLEKKLKNENSTTIETEQKQNTTISKINEIIDEKI